MQYGRKDFECKRPSMPENSEYVHGEDRLCDRANECSDAGELEDTGQEGVRCGIDAVED